MTASARRRPSFLADCKHVRVCLVIFATGGFVDLTLFSLDYFLIDFRLQGASWTAVPCAPIIRARRMNEKAKLMPDRMRKTIAPLKLL